MPHLYSWRADPSIRIYGPEAGEVGPWNCTCPKGLEHAHKPRWGHPRAPMCRHLDELLAVATREELSGRFTETPAGREKTDAGCACNGGRPLRRLPPPTPPPAPIPGVVSKNAPCPCGSGKKYKRCHGAPGVEIQRLLDLAASANEELAEREGDHGEPYHGEPEEELPPAKPAKRTPAEKKIQGTERRAKERKAEKARKAAIAERLDLAIQHAHEADEARRTARAKRKEQGK